MGTADEDGECAGDCGDKFKLMKNKLILVILFGGQSAEHEVSIRSAKNIFEALDKDKYDPILVGIDKNGNWHRSHDFSFSGKQVVLVKNEIVDLADPEKREKIDIVFPVLHGPFGEDGTVQGLLELANVPFVGAGVLGSAVGMDKDVMKRLLRDGGLPIGKFLVFRRGEKLDFGEITKELGLPLFIKPANLGSSVGISKAHNEEEFLAGAEEAFKYDRKIIIEEFVKGREIEVAVLGNDGPMASIPGEIVVHDDFYAYETKYLDENGATLEIPAKLSDEEIKKAQELAIKVFKVLECEGLGRVDFFLKENGEFFVNEINTLPGFTSSSMYPKLWEYRGIRYNELIDKLIQLALEKYD